MKVIKKAPGAEVKTKRFSCAGCRALLEVGGRDLKLQPDSRDGDAYTFRCPECKHETWIAAVFIPSAMRAAAKR